MYLTSVAEPSSRAGRQPVGGPHRPPRLLPAWRFIALFCLILLILSNLPAYAQAPTPPAEQPFVPGQLLVRFRRDIPAAMSASSRLAARLQTLQTVRSLALELVAVEEGQEAETLAQLRNNPLVEYVGFNYIAHIAGEPSDPGWWRQWNMRQIDAPAAWDLSTGSDLIVAIVDTGVDLRHPELSAKLVAGYDFVNGDDTPADDHGHGTHVAGIVAAAANNGIGIAGVSWGARIMPVKVLDAHGDGGYFQIIQGIRYAADHGARIINLSLGGSQPDPNMRAAIQYANDRGCLVVAATGNQAGPLLYPAAYTETLAVAATTDRQTRPDYSNYGPAVDVAAPGGSETAGIYSLAPGGSYATLYGTSMAAPHVSGAAALIWSLAPSVTAGQVAQLLRDTASKVGGTPYDSSGRNDYLGHGQINIAAALRRIAGSPPATPTRTLTPPSPATPTSTPTPQLYTQEITLKAGWNLVSFSVRPTTAQIEALTTQLRPALELVLGYQCQAGGLSYYPDLPAAISTLQTLEAGRGYWLKMSDRRVWRIVGEPLPSDAPLALCAGWNLAGYLPTRQWPAALAFAPLGDALVVALGYQDQQGKSYYPDLKAPLNSLHTLQPGDGYWLLTSRPAILSYPR